MCVASSALSFIRFCVDFFFFQAEDGIRDLVRSRGLGDVYKRQIQVKTRSLPVEKASSQCAAQQLGPARGGCPRGRISAAVSYTHLTLPTSDLV